ncbi:hypothetical protein [Devosia ginsengisoli]|uniref:Uncharacterized protein n=1 Tax=Devosia ginsengisoli TaxID=400770 RepID=A0A5B8LXQ8_9HYPH|nr:hypothetical protein [Devosia ginsengisoli]QDZ13097.1 hypothetical protein FPZ08_21575 [Devosia ginsengisoli]
MQQSEFNIAELTALLPWQEYNFPARNILVVSGILGAFVVVAWLIERGSVSNYAFGFLAIVILVPAALFYVQGSTRGNWLIYPVGMDRDGIVGPGMWGTTYIPWSQVIAVAHVSGIVGGAIRPIQPQLVIYKRRGFASRLSLPHLSDEEQEQLFSVLAGLSVLRGFRLVLSHTPEGQRWLKQAPWL